MSTPEQLRRHGNMTLDGQQPNLNGHFASCRPRHWPREVTDALSLDGPKSNDLMLGRLGDISVRLASPRRYSDADCDNQQIDRSKFP